MNRLEWMTSNSRLTEIAPIFDRRLELKFAAPRVGIPELEEALSTSFTREFPTRSVHSIYFDTPGLLLFEEAEEGINPRMKYRVRWYDDAKDSLAIEIKQSESLSRLKSVHHLPVGSEMPTHLHTRRGLLAPVALVSYRREYFSSERGRLTIDNNVTTTVLRNGRTQHHRMSVAEFKTPFHAASVNADYARIFTTDRFSKYSLALYTD